MSFSGKNRPIINFSSTQKHSFFQSYACFDSKAVIIRTTIKKTCFYQLSVVVVLSGQIFSGKRRRQYVPFFLNKLKQNY
jgi:hypothetical protein